MAGAARCVAVAVAVSLAALAPAWAQDSGSQDLKKEVDALKKKVAALEGEKPAPPPVPVSLVDDPAPSSQDKAQEFGQPAWPVAGIYTDSNTKDIGKMLKLPALEGVKIRGWVDTYWASNNNHPRRLTVDANQGSSIVKGNDVSIEGRVFDIHDNSISLSLAEIEIERAPDMGEVGFKLDIAFGETQSIIGDSISAATPASIYPFEKTFQHASVSYLAPIGRGLRIDMGKFVTHIGGETIETVKNWNYSHSYYFTYGIPFQDVGIHLNYSFTDWLAVDGWALDGWNVTVDNNKGKTYGASATLTPVPWFAFTNNVLVGPEQNDNYGNYRFIWDAQLVLGPFENFTFMVAWDIAAEQRASTPAGVQHAKWEAFAAYVRYHVNDWFEPSLRAEYYSDDDGFTTGVQQDVREVAATLNMRVGINKWSVLLVRPEVRFDRSSEKFFTDHSTFRSDKGQITWELGVTWMF